MCIFNYLLGQSNIVFKRLRRSIDHDRSKSTVDAVLAQLEGIAVIKMKCDRNLRILNYSCFYKFHQVGVVRICARALGNLKDYRAVQLACSFGNTLNDFHVVHIESADGITAVISLFKHFSRSN